MATISKAFGKTMRHRRQKLGLSQEALAELADIHRTYVSSLELGKVGAGIDVLYKIARALKIPLSRLIREAEKYI